MPKHSEAAVDSREIGGEITPLGRLRELHRNLHILAAVVHRVLEENPVESLPDSQISVDQMRLLHFVALNQGARMRDVARGLGIKPASASLAVDRLQRKGFVRRRTNTEDRRGVHLETTREGRALVSQVAHAIDAKLSEAIRQIGAEDVDRFTELSAQLARTLMVGQSYFGDVCLQCGVGCSETCPIHEMFKSCPYEP